MTVVIADLIKRAQLLIDVSDSPRLDVELLLCHVLQKDRTWLFTWPDKTLDEEQLARFEALFERRKLGEPVAYILEQREFWSLPLKVSPATLIPRPDTEVLVEAVLSLGLTDGARVLDLGTGTGAVALALASEKKHWQISAVDFSGDAVALAKENSSNLGLPLDCFQSDWFSNIASERRFDLIVSNPPYIDNNDPHLQQGDVRFEPSSALVSASQGFADIEEIISGATQFLTPGGCLAFEHGWKQGEGARERLGAAGFSQVETRKDLNGNDRVTLGFLGPP